MRKSEYCIKAGLSNKYYFFGDRATVQRIEGREGREKIRNR